MRTPYSSFLIKGLQHSFRYIVFGEDYCGHLTQALGLQALNRGNKIGKQKISFSGFTERN
jgi:hypothetical protein